MVLFIFFYRTLNALLFCIYIFKGSEGELNRVANSPSQHLHRSGELKVSRNTPAHPVIAIRNRALYDDGADYSDYDEVKRLPGRSY